ncbi:MAG: Glu-tRNA(Gln) amidotransferase subunit GatE [Candidatus Aenigmatarchaeota archaeon]
MDYKRLGLKVGLEVHQQLDTKHKLFCNCPIIKSDEFPSEIKRRIRTSASELGEYDPAALYEFLRERTFVYKINAESSCLVEADEEPPRQINDEALRIAIQICRLLNCDLLDEIHVMRKTVIDGSSVSSFQRTSLIGMNGFIETDYGAIKISTVCLEEDSAPAISRSSGTVEYRLDRLGIPLVEIATSADIASPEQAKEVAEKIGLLLRSTNVLRGIGTIRQDVNISIENGARVEIKGFQELAKIPKIVENEVRRQLDLIDIKNELHKRGTREVKEEFVNAMQVFRNTNCTLLKKIISDGGIILAARLQNFSGLLKRQCGDRTFGKELSSYAAAFGFGIIHSDEDLSKYNLITEFDILKKELNAGERDLILIVAGRNPDKAMRAVLQRAGYCLIGVPEETRVSDELGSKYTRPLPGAGRMYPESDIPPVWVSRELRTVEIPKTLLEKEAELGKKLPDEIVSQLIKSRDFPLFEELIKKFDIEPIIIANLFLSTFKDMRRCGLATEKIRKEDIESVLALLESKRISKDSLPAIFTALIEGKSIEDIANDFSMLADPELESMISDVVDKNPGKKESILMGLVMAKVRGRADGESVSRILKMKMK